MSANSRGAAERPARRGLLLATVAAMLWGTVGVASTMLPDGGTLSSFHLGFARLAIAAPLLVLFSALVLGRGLWAAALILGLEGSRSRTPLAGNPVSARAAHAKG
jgi:hypothetical protein